MQIVDRPVLRVSLVVRCLERQAGVDPDREGRIRAVTVGIGDRVGQGGGASPARRAGQRACAGGKVQTRRQDAGQSVRVRPRASGRFRQLQIADRRAPRVSLVARCSQRQAGADRNREGRNRAGAVGIGDRVGQGGGTSGGARRAGQRACAGGKAQTRRQGAGQSVHQRRRAAGRYWQLQIADRRVKRVILVVRRGQRQAGVDRNREGRNRAHGGVGIGDRVGQGGGTSRARRAGQRACAGGKDQTRRQAAWPGQSVHRRPRDSDRFRQRQIGNRCVKRVILVVRRGQQRQEGADRNPEDPTIAGTVGVADPVGQGEGTTRARRTGQYACAGVKAQTRWQTWHAGQSVRVRPRASGRCRQCQTGDRRALPVNLSARYKRERQGVADRAPRVSLVARCSQRQVGVDRDHEVHTRVGTVGIGDRVGQGGGISRVRRAGQRACAGGKGQTRRHIGQSVGQRRRAAGRFRQLQIGDRLALCVILVVRRGQRFQAGVDCD